MRRALRTLAINTAAAMFAVVSVGGASLGRSWRDAAVNFGVSFLFANCIGTPAEYVLSAFAPRVWHRFRFPWNWAVLVSMQAAIAVLGSLAAISLLILGGLIPATRFGEWFAGSIRISLFATLTFGIVITIYERLRGRLESTTLELRTKERDEAEARRLAAEARLTAFESRVQPHFLFNTLNSIAALIPNDPSGAEQMVGRLSALLRASLDPSRSTLVPLAEELRTVRDYLEIERVRFGDRLNYELPAGDALTDIRLPRLALQTLVENSVKYAVSPSRDGARIRVRAARTDRGARISVEDDGPGFDGTHVPANHGIALVRDRLAATLGSNATLRIESRTGLSAVVIDLPAGRS
jgi:signal transduction histidine kinase